MVSFKEFEFIHQQMIINLIIFADIQFWNNRKSLEVS